MQSFDRNYWSATFVIKVSSFKELVNRKMAVAQVAS
jgi:hypothetical protein